MGRKLFSVWVFFSLFAGLYLKTHDFLQPFEKSHARESPIDSAAAGPTERPPDHVLPGGVGTYTIGHVSGLASIRSSIKHEQVTCVPSARAAESSGHYAGVPFSLWEEPGANKDPTGSRGTASFVLPRDLHFFILRS